MAEALKLPARMDLSAAQNLVNTLSKTDLAAGVQLDATDVKHLGALCAQAILSASQAAKDAGGRLEISNMNDRVEKQLAVMGLSKEMLEGDAP